LLAAMFVAGPLDRAFVLSLLAFVIIHNLY
jgi:hypothetical protein